MYSNFSPKTYKPSSPIFILYLCHCDTLEYSVYFPERFPVNGISVGVAAAFKPAKPRIREILHLLFKKMTECVNEMSVPSEVGTLFVMGNSLPIDIYLLLLSYY